MYRIIPFIALLFVSCSSGGVGTSSNATAGLTRQQAIEIMRRLERQPLAGGATEERRVVFEWISTAPELKGIDIDTRYLNGFEGSGYVFEGEMLIQYAIGLALWRLDLPEGEEGSKRAQVEAGLASMLAAYRNIIRLDAKLGDRWLDNLDAMEKKGEVKSYIARIDGER